jgi:bifunctional DNA-binding transcriptional regulator/antitoxin component of YhaV-PrlF toxin-antitoxin module
MPQLVKGGKYAYGWSRVDEEGRIIVPGEAAEEYRLVESAKLILMPGSRTSGGFGLASAESLRLSAVGVILAANPQLGEFRLPAGEVVEYKKRLYCWLELRRGGVTVPSATLPKYGIGSGDSLLVVRGSGLAIGFIVRGPIVAEAKRHRELVIFEPEA